ncbi:hypothetical protein V2W45_92302 [Cenococcum geophilum]
MSRSLGKCIESIFDPLPPLRGYGYLVMVWKLYRLLAIGGRDSKHPQKVTFLRRLTDVEKRVLYLLEEWWDGWIKEDILTRFTKGMLLAYAVFELRYYYENEEETAGFEEFLLGTDDKSLYETVKKQVLETHEGEYFTYVAIRSHRERQKGGRVYDDPILTDITAYNRELFHLAKVELLLEICPEDMRTEERRSAGIMAACQRVANECVANGMKLIGQADEPEGIIVHMAGRDLRVAINSSQLREPWPREKKAIGHCYYNPGAVVDGCPWLTTSLEKLEDDSDTSSDDKNFDLREILWNLQQLDLMGPPYYLWSIKEKRTVKVSDLGISPMYAIISHTWGRWRIPGENIEIPGVPWAVPANTRFDVATLPAMIENAAFPEDYVWIDLFCIPQDRDDPEQQRICRMELIRQANIFRNAATAVAWLFDVEDWGPTAAALAYLAVEFHNNSTNEEHTESMPLYNLILQAAGEHANRRCGLLEGDIYAKSGDDVEFISWFSSLWTLQEVLMRPDMLLLNRNLEPLVVWHVTMTLDTIACLVMCRSTTFHNPKDSRSKAEKLEAIRQVSMKLPSGPREIYVLFSVTGMVQIARPSRLSALTLGGKRVCKHSRSQAIMSVTGATLWFRHNDFQQFSDPESPDNMIFGLYEPGFINELFHLVGGSFFLCRNEGPTVTAPPETVHKGETQIRITHSVSGSMLPFSPGSATRFVSFPEKHRELVDHPSVAGWRIGMGRDPWTGNKGGDVRLPTVVVLAANCEWESEPPVVPQGEGQLESSPQAVGAVPEGAKTIKCQIAPRARPLKGTVQGNMPGPEYDEGSVIEVDDVGIDEWVSKFELDTFAVCVMNSRTEVRGVLLQRPGFGHGPLIKIGVFEIEDEEGIELPDACRVDWTVM